MGDREGAATMSEAEKAFYEWFHKNHYRSGALLNEYREAFVAGWDAFPAADEDPEEALTDE